MQKIKIFDLMSGIGAFPLGAKRALGEENVEVVGYSEIEKNAIAIYKRHFPQEKNYGDATKINPADIPDFDLLCAGTPCQSFSIAGKRGGFQDTRGTMFFEVARILDYKKPPYLLLENVKGLLSSDDGRTFQRILRVLSDIGYFLQWEVLNSRNFGVPQNRERVYLIGHYRDKSRPEIFPIQRNGGEADSVQSETGREREGLQGEVSEEDGCSTGIEGGGTVGRRFDNGKRVSMIHNKYGGFKEEAPREFADYSPTLRTPAGGGHIPDVKIQEVVPLTEARTDEAKQVRREMQKEGKDWCGRRDKQLQPREDGHVGAVTTGKSNEQLLCVASRGGGGRKTDEQELEARDDDVTNALTNVQKDNYVLSKGGDGKLHTPEDVSQCLESGTSGGGGTSNRPHVLEKTKIRRLMPVEYERLQDFPDGYTEYGIGMKGDKSVIGFHFENQVINDDGEVGEVLVEEFAKAKQDGEVIKISDTARYQVLGNSITVAVVEHIIGKLFKGGEQ